ncbi:UNVERIFIED_CONTAM: hypothetical protein Scaly_2909700 [Sesamum calycinum]|uniref:Transposase-associated domain-containing protein n=1 Tax=Sesamum calycinum TaxID=2727403 RepID=A0AAW2L4B0_9LAMI
MYNKNFSGRANLKPEFEDGVKTFIKWAKGQCRHMDGDKIRCPYRKCKNTKFGTPDEVNYHLCMQGFMVECYNWTSHGEDIVQDYYEAPSVPQVSEEPTSTGHVEGVPDNGMRSVPVDAGTSSYVYGGGGPYDYYESGLADRFFNIVCIPDEEVVPVSIVAVDNQSYDLCDPNGLQVVLEAAGTSWGQLHENDDKNEDEDSGRDGKTDDKEYEAT